jgi:DNA-binding Lrp family transcriptional regulator
LYKLSDVDIRVFHLVQHQAELDVPEVARQLRMKSHTVRRSIGRMREAGAIRKIAFIDPSLIGAFEARAFLAVRHTEQRPQSTLYRFLERQSKVGYVGEVGGEFQLAFSYWATGIGDLHLFIDEISRQFGRAIRATSVSIITSSRHFGVRYLLPNGAAPLEIDFATTISPIAPLDQLDSQILWRIAETPELTFRVLARDLGCAESTIQFRVSRLRKTGVLRGFGYRLGSVELGLHTSYLLLSIRGHRAQVAQRLIRFARESEHILALQECIGSWDFALVVQGTEPHIAISVSQALDELLPADIVAARILPSYRVRKLFFRPVGST